MTAPCLTWSRDAHGYIARFGDEGQGEARVLPWRESWVWIVDALPFDIEPAISSRFPYLQAADAQRAAEAQVEAWPSLIEGARRV
jgi:hypothetical protein